MARHSVFDRYRRPAYTGDNRCLPCTVTNTLIAVLGGQLVAGGLLVAGQSLPIAAAVGGLAILFGLAQIWLRGYLVPGTPTLTKRYFPPWLLQLFGKESAPNAQAMLDAEQQRDVEDILVDANALQFDETGEDFELVDTFATAWQAAIDDVAEADDLPGHIETAFGVEGAIQVEETERATIVRLDNRIMGRWESRAAMIADVASCAILADRYEGWADLPPAQRGHLAGGLRLYIEQCPACGGPTSFDTETTTSCCSEHEVATVSCVSCGVRLFEIPVESAAIEPAV
ncbi:hypothetical protein [Halorhabdus sp. CUG00001]|uniref:hypothetical protein n=1 Tax=Halorhabdus sp. CUG00001 TaxID=2600297 RepID=UPI00131DCC52|nr:hypothetical protein [Halorhabdus sp. CUG00001]